MEPRRPKHKQFPPLDVTESELEAALREPKTYEYDPNVEEVFLAGAEDPKTQVSVIKTHMSMVFLLPNRVYKVKKSVDFGFADFTTLYKRFQACMAEVQLNQRLAPNVYIGIVPISMQRESRKITVRCDDFWTPEKNPNLDYWLNDEYGEIIEWAVHMIRLPESQTLLYRLERNRITPEIITDLAQKLVSFHRNARKGPKIDPFGEESVIRANIDENFTQTEPHVGVTVDPGVYQRIKSLTYQRLTECSSTIALRVKNGHTCDSHGDLRLEHVYMKGAGSNRTFLIVDCIEFNEKFRYGDPLSDVAFLMMDLWRKGRPDLARHLQREYLLDAVQDTPENSRLFVLYAAYRAVVRAKVSGFRVADASLEQTHRERESQRSRCYWLVALSLLSPFAERPCLILIGGLPASGKSSLAKMMSEAGTKMHWIRTDEIRKNLFLKAQQEQKTSEDKTGSFEEGLYTAEMTQQTYAKALEEAASRLREGQRVVVDATFRDTAQRERFTQMAHAEGALMALIVCECNREIVKGRLLARKNDISDATWEIFEAMEKEWAPLDPDRADFCIVNTEKEKEVTLRRAETFLRKMELL